MYCLQLGQMALPIIEYLFLGQKCGVNCLATWSIKAI